MPFKQSLFNKTQERRKRMRNISMPNQTQLFSDKNIYSDDYINADTFDITQTDFDYIILAKNDIEFEKMKATLDKYMYLSNEYMVNEYAAKHITATIYMKKDIELDGRTLYAGQKGFLIDGEGMSGQIKMSILFRDSWKHISLEDKALLQSYKHAYKVQEIVLQNGLAETMYDVLDEIEVDRHFEIVQAIKKRLLDHPLTKKEENMFQLYKTADAYLNAIKYVENQEEIKLDDYLDLSVIPADSDNTPDPQKELQLREDFMKNVSEIEKRMEPTQEKTSEENILLSSPPDRLALANKLDIDPRDSSAILTLEPFTAEQAKPFMRAGLPFCHVGLVKDGNEVPYTKDSIDTNAAVYLIPTTLDTIDQDLSIFKNDYFVINPMEMSIKEVRTMKFLFHAMENWEEIQLPKNFISNLLSDYANGNKKLSIEDIANLRESCFSPTTMAQASINHDYTMPELVETLYPSNTRLSAHKQERINEQIRLNHQAKEVATTEELPLNEDQQINFSEQVDAVINRTYPFYSSLKICDTPQILLDIGCDQLPMLYTQRHLRDAIRPKNPDKGHHGLTVNQIKAMPELLADPVMVFDSLSRDDSIVVMTTEVDEDLSPVIATIRPNGQGRYIVDTNISSNYVTSIYGRDNFPSHFEQLIANNKILYCNKEKSQELFERWGLQLPELTNNLNFDIIIRQSENIVKENEKTVSETLQEIAGTEELATTITPDQITEILQSHEEHISSLLQNGKPTIIINAYAGAGAGKTTSCLDICAGLKKAGYSAEYVQEYVKELVYDGSNLLDGTAAHQFEILQEQLKRQDRFVGKVDFIVTDGPILLNGIYNQELTSEYSNMLTQLQNQYETAGAKNFNFFVNRDQRPDHYEQGGRLQTFDESVKIDKEVKDMLRESVPYYGNYGHDTVNKVIANAIKTREKHIATQNKKDNQATLKEPQKVKSQQSMPHKHFYTREESQVMVQYLKENISIADIISQYEPLTKGSRNRYFKGANHDSLVVDTQRGKNCFYWNSIGAKGSVIDALTTPELGNMTKTEALNYLYDLVGGEEAVYEVCFGTRREATPRPNKITYTPKTPLVSVETTTPEPGNVDLPPKGNTRKNVYAYLSKTRMIHKEVINEFFNREMLYQDDHRNCVFVAYDKENNVNFAMRRGTNTYKRFVGDCKGSDYSHGFYVDNGAKELFVGEGVIDIMSKMSLLAEKGIDYHKYNYLAMTGTQKQEPLENILTTYPENKKVTLGLDNDKGGKEALDQIMESLKTSGVECMIDMPFPSGQDWNDYLKDYMTDKQSLPETPKQKVSQERLEPENDFKKVNERTPFDKKGEMNPIKASAAMTKHNHFAPTPGPEIDQ